MPHTQTTAKNSFRILCFQTPSRQIQTVSMAHPERSECLLLTPQQQFFSNFVFSTSAPTDPDCLCGASRAARMPLIYTTVKILFEFCVLNRRLDRSIMSLWDIPMVECPLPAPQQKFYLNFVSSTGAPTYPDCPYGISRVAK